MCPLCSKPPAEAETLESKSHALRKGLRSLGRLLVAYSGGVDSGFLAWSARRELGDAMLAVLADSPSLARSQRRDAEAFAEEQGIPLTVINTDEMERPEYLRNDAARCYHCKTNCSPPWKRTACAPGSMPLPMA